MQRIYQLRGYLNGAGTEDGLGGKEKQSWWGPPKVCNFHTIDHAKVEDGIHQHASFPEVVTHVLQPVGIQTAHRLAVLRDPERNADRIVLPALLMALRFVEKGEDLHFCWDL